MQPLVNEEVAAAGYSITIKTDVRDGTLLNARVPHYTHFC